MTLVAGSGTISRELLFKGLPTPHAPSSLLKPVSQVSGYLHLSLGVCRQRRGLNAKEVLECSKRTYSSAPRQLSDPLVSPLHRKSHRRWRVTSEQTTLTESSSDVLSTEDLLLSCSTFNVLAPIYKRLGNEVTRESSFPDTWRPRNQKIIDALLAKRSSIICLQEIWLSNPDLVNLYETELGNAGYQVFKLPRPNNRGDGLLTAVQTDRLEVVHQENHTLLNDCGDRVAQFLWLRSTPKADKEGPHTELLVVNTHLLFPHNTQSSFIRLRQVHKILENLEKFKAKHGLGPMPVILCGDLNGTKKGQVYRFLRSQGFASSFDIARNYPDKDHRWVSHKNHNGVVVGVDFIWLLNPTEDAGSMAADWRAAVFSFLGKKLNEIGYCDERAVFNFLSGAADGDDCFSDSEEEEKDAPLTSRRSRAAVALGTEPVITMSGFESAVARIASVIGLTKGEMEELLQLADVDGNGVVDFRDFKAAAGQLFKAIPLGDHGNFETFSTAGGQEPSNGSVGFEVKDATLFPPETEDGVWPQDWALSDHALLTATFLPRCFPTGAPA